MAFQITKGFFNLHALLINAHHLFGDVVLGREIAEQQPWLLLSCRNFLAAGAAIFATGFGECRTTFVRLVVKIGVGLS